MSIFSCCCSSGNPEEISLLPVNKTPQKESNRIAEYLKSENPRVGFLFVDLTGYKSLENERGIDAVSSSVDSFAKSRVCFFAMSIMLAGACVSCWYILMEQVQSHPEDQQTPYLATAITFGCAVSLLFAYILYCVYRYTRDSFNEMKAVLVEGD